MTNEQYLEIIKRLDLIEFRQELLFNNTGVDRSLFEYGLTREQYRKIMDIMDEYRDRIDKGLECHHGTFEKKIYEVVPEHAGDYHMCEEFAKGFMEEGRWEDVFIKLYGDMPKYSYLKRR